MVKIYPSGPQIESRLGNKNVSESQSNVYDQMNLSSTINRMDNLRAQYRAIPQEGMRAADSIQNRGEAFAQNGAERAEQLRDVVNQSIGKVSSQSSQDVANKTAVVLARSQPGTVESGKGSNFDSDA